VDIDGNNALSIKGIGVTISTFETLPSPVRQQHHHLRNPRRPKLDLVHWRNSAMYPYIRHHYLLATHFALTLQPEQALLGNNLSETPAALVQVAQECRCVCVSTQARSTAFIRLM
jgi:hypothetical protein